MITTQWQAAHLPCQWRGVGALRGCSHTDCQGPTRHTLNCDVNDAWLSTLHTTLFFFAHCTLHSVYMCAACSKLPLSYCSAMQSQRIDCLPGLDATIVCWVQLGCQSKTPSSVWHRSILDNDDAGDGGFEDVSDALVLLPMLASGNLNLFKKSLAAKALWAASSSASFTQFERRVTDEMANGSFGLQKYYSTLELAI